MLRPVGPWRGGVQDRSECGGSSLLLKPRSGRSGPFVLRLRPATFTAPTSLNCDDGLVRPPVEVMMTIMTRA